MGKISIQAKIFLRNRIEYLMHKGYNHRQAIAVAYADARKKGFKVPKRPLKKWKI